MLYLKLFKAFDGMEGRELTQPELINITFGAPLFGNYVMEEDLKNKGYLDNMYHFAATSDVVPALLSIGHTFKIIREKIGSAKSWIKGNLPNLQVLEGVQKVLLCWNNAVSLTQDPNSKSTLNTLISSYDQLMKSLEPSTLMNKYNEFNYVPIGKFLLLQKQQNGKHSAIIMEDKKLVERILQGATEFQASNIESLISEHKLPSYGHKIKDHLGGLAQFNHQRKLVPYADEVFSNSFLHVETVSRFFCGYDDCQESSHISFYEQDDSLVRKLIFCQTCQKDKNVLEPYFHQVCSEKFHGSEKADHTTKPFDLSTVDAEERHNFFLSKKQYQLEVIKKGESWEILASLQKVVKSIWGSFQL